MQWYTSLCHLMEFIPKSVIFLRLLVLCLVHPDLFVIYYCFFFFKECISFIGSLDKCHTSIFNASISYVVHRSSWGCSEILYPWDKVLINVPVILKPKRTEGRQEGNTEPIKKVGGRVLIEDQAAYFDLDLHCVQTTYMTLFQISKG